MSTESSAFFEKPILNSPYAYPGRHWELDDEGRPTNTIVESRRSAKFVTPIPKPKKTRGKASSQPDLGLTADKAGADAQDYDLTSIINEVRGAVDRWRTLPQEEWRVTPETARLLSHWRSYPFGGIRPFFCQIEAVETAVWLTEVAPHTADGKKLLSYLRRVNQAANPAVNRLALKLATGAGKTMVMAMLIAWQTVNAVRHPSSSAFTRGFLIVTPGLTIRDRLRVLQPNDPDNYYTSRELLPPDLLPVIRNARIVITNYHAFKPRERTPLAKGTRALIAGRRGEAPPTLESPGQMMQRVMPELMAFKNVMVINDEAHHCYREKPTDREDEALKGDDRKEAERNTEAARLWISGIEAVGRKIGVQRVVDLSATPFFLSGSGYQEGTLFPWTMSDFSLMDAIECGIVKLPRVPVAENVTGNDMPVYRNLWEHIGKEMPKKGRGKAGALDPLQLPAKLQTALEVLYGHYEKTFALWAEHKVGVPPCFIIVCQNTTISKLVYDYVSGFLREADDGTQTLVNGRLALFRNYEPDTDLPLARPNTILVDSEQLEAGDVLDANFRAMAADEIERFRRDIIERTGDPRAADAISDQELLREVMNTVGKRDQLGAQVRCVVSVSMLTEGWDANNVTHILGIRAFGTQLLCEQVIGRALRRQSYDLTPDNLFAPEYADIFGIPFDFTAQAVQAPPQPPRETIQVKALRPERDHLVIRFPRVVGYRVEPPTDVLTPDFNEDSTMVLTPELVGPSRVLNSGIIGESAEMNLDHMDSMRRSSLLFHLTHYLIATTFREPGQPAPMHLFGSLKRVVRYWLDHHLVCKGDTYPALLLYKELADMFCNRINDAVRRSLEGSRPITAILDPFNPTGSTEHVRFVTTRTERYETTGPPPRNHVNWVICDSEWEAEFCRVAESNGRVLAYTKNHNLGFEVPYRYGSTTRRYLPDFIVLVDDGRGASDPLHLVVEIKGYRGEDAKEKASTMRTYWVPGVNHLRSYGRWAFAEFTDLWTMETEFATKIEEQLEQAIAAAGAGR
ncbi:MAG: restriction endonuclease [Spirochaetaceae bacterium]|nr:MAG: restriction endonuclease [Spirochaetaceae bacterium]